MKRTPNVLIGENEGIIAADLMSLFKSWGWDNPYITRDIQDVKRKSAYSHFDLVVIDENIVDNESVFSLILQLVRSGKSRVILLSDSMNRIIPDSLKNCSTFYCLPKPFNYRELDFAANTRHCYAAAM